MMNVINENKVRAEWSEFLLNLQFNIFGTCSFPQSWNITMNTAERNTLNYFKRLKNKYDLPFGAFYLIPKSRINPHHSPPHVHFLLHFNQCVKTINYDRGLLSLLKNIATDPYYNNKTGIWSRYFATCDIQRVESIECINYIDKNLYGLIRNIDENYRYDFFREGMLNSPGTGTTIQ